MNDNAWALPTWYRPRLAYLFAGAALTLGLATIAGVVLDSDATNHLIIAALVAAAAELIYATAAFVSIWRRNPTRTTPDPGR